MKIDDAALQSILKTYGNESPKVKNNRAARNEIVKQKDINREIQESDIEIINYNSDGKINLNPETEKSIIDFFQ